MPHTNQQANNKECLFIHNETKNIIIMNNRAKIFAAAAAGVVAGIIAGVLFAPGKGIATRKKIKEEGEKLAGDVQDKFRKGWKKFDDLKENIEQLVKEKADEFA